MMPTKQQYEDRQAHAANICAIADETGRYADDRHELLASRTAPEVSVRDLWTGQLVAFSSTRADRDSSLEEFAWDFFASGEQ